MKMKFLCIVIIQLLFFSCQTDVLDEMEPLNSEGKQFMTLISTYENWQTDWQTETKMGTPLPNEAAIRFFLSQNSYYIVPIVREKEITSIALYPILVDGGKNLVTTSPTIISKEEAKNNILLQGLLKSTLFSVWKANGYSINFEENRKVLIQDLPLTRHISYQDTHMFCLEGDITFYYYSEEDYRRCISEQYAACARYRFAMSEYGFTMKGADGYICAYIDAATMPFDEAMNIFYACYERLELELRSIDGVTDVDIYAVNMNEGIVNSDGDSGSESKQDEVKCPYGKCSGDPCTCCSICQGPCKCPNCHKDPCECIRNVLLTIKSTTTGEMAVVRIGTTTEQYYVPLYNVVLEGTDDSGNAVVVDYVAIRFGVKYENDIPVVKGLQDEKTYTISDFIPAYCGESPAGDAWRIFGGHLLHAGPRDPEFGCCMYGCVGICNARFVELNEKLLLYSNAKTNEELAKSGKFKVHVEAAVKPPLIPKD